jgi:hypothetical protein
MFQRQRRNAPRLAAAIMVLSTSASMLALGAASTALADVIPDQLALATLDAIVQGDYPAAAAQFDPTMQKVLPVRTLGEAWAKFQQTLGAYQSHGDPQDSQRGELTVVNVPLQMEHKPGRFRLSVHPDGTIAGLYFLREGDPAP